MANFRHPIADDYLMGPQGTSVGEVILRNGAPARIRSFAVFTTYSFSGLVTGLPTSEINEDCLKEIREWVAKRYNTAMPIHFVNAKLLAMELENGKAADRWPLFFFVAEIESDSFDADEVWSSLMLVDFRDDGSPENGFASIKDVIAGLDWEALAGCWSP